MISSSVILQRRCSRCFIEVLPDAIENHAIRIDSDVDIGDDDVVEVASLLVSEESVRHPDLAGVGDGEVGDLVCQWRILHTTQLSYYC